MDASAGAQKPRRGRFLRCRTPEAARGAFGPPPVSPAQPKRFLDQHDQPLEGGSRWVEVPRARVGVLEHDRAVGASQPHIGLHLLMGAPERADLIASVDEVERVQLELAGKEIVLDQTYVSADPPRSRTGQRLRASTRRCRCRSPHRRARPTRSGHGPSRARHNLHPGRGHRDHRQSLRVAAGRWAPKPATEAGASRALKSVPLAGTRPNQLRPLLTSCAHRTSSLCLAVENLVTARRSRSIGAVGRCSCQMIAARTCPSRLGLDAGR